MGVGAIGKYPDTFLMDFFCVFKMPEIEIKLADFIIQVEVIGEFFQGFVENIFRFLEPFLPEIEFSQAFWMVLVARIF